MSEKKFPIEHIPDEACLFCRIHKQNMDFEKNAIKLVAFDPTPYVNPDGLSVNWDKYSTAQITKDSVAEQGKKPKNYAVVSFITGNVRQIPLGVVHDPIHEPAENQAHALILEIPPRSQNNAAVTSKLVEMAVWEVYFER